MLMIHSLWHYMITRCIAFIIFFPQIHNLILIMTNTRQTQIIGHSTKYLTTTLQKFQDRVRQGR